MKNLKVKLSIAMIVSTLAILLTVLILLNVYEKYYILDKANDALITEANYFEESESFYQSKREGDRLYDVNVMVLSDEEEGGLFGWDFLNQENDFFNKAYREGTLVEDEIMELEEGDATYYVLLIKIKNRNMMKTIPYLMSYPSQLNIKGSTPVLLYIDISAYRNVIHKLKIAFSVLLVVAVIMAGLLGIFFGGRLEENQRKLGHFFQNASHELKTPLTSIKGYAEGIKTGAVEDQDGAAEVIIRQSERMQTLIDEILTISRLDSKDYVLKKEEVDVLSIIEDSVEKYQDLPDKRHIQTELMLDERNFMVMGDGLQLYKAVNTIIDNAFKFALHQVKIRTYGERNRLNIDVFNDGRPLSKKDLAHIFDRFYSGENISTGIGLAMAREIITAGQGEITAWNREDGVLFRVSLPIR